MFTSALLCEKSLGLQQGASPLGINVFSGQCTAKAVSSRIHPILKIDPDLEPALDLASLQNNKQTNKKCITCAIMTACLKIQNKKCL